MTVAATNHGQSRRSSRTAAIAATAVTPTSAAAPINTHTAAGVTVDVDSARWSVNERWRCDICKIRLFPSFAEACAHEETCQLIVPSQLDTDQEHQEEIERVEPLEQHIKCSIDQNEQPKMRPSSLLLSQPKPLEIPTSKENRKRRNGDASTKPSSKTPSSSLHSFFSSAPSKANDVICVEAPLHHPTKGTRTISSGKVQDPRSSATALHKDAHQATQPTRRARRRGTAPSEITKLAPLQRIPQISQASWSDDVIVLDDDEALQVEDKVKEEQRVMLHFMEQRRRQAQLERDKRERQRLRRLTDNADPLKPQPLRRSTGDCANEAINVDGNDDSEATTRTRTNHAEMVVRRGPTGRGTNGRAHDVNHLAPLFPVPSHTIPDSIDSSQKALSVFKGEPPSSKGWKPTWRRCTDNDAILIDLDDCISSIQLFPAPTSPLFNARHWEGCDTSSSSSTMQAILSTSFRTDPCQSELSPRGSSLWVDRYYNRKTLRATGASLQAAHDHLYNFVKRFMVKRQKAETLMAERHEQREQQRHGKRKQTWRKQDDDDFWDSEDEANSAEHKSSLFLLTGPIGCGKSQLVHSVAHELGCRTVVELHTGMPRGAAAVKRHIEEATRSHSTFDMMQNKKSKTALNAWFQKSPRHDLSDVDSDVEGNVLLNHEPSSAVTVILIDEIDNLFDGDCSIWSALGELYKHSKCPIVLTANAFPKALDSSTFQFQHVELEPPTMPECALQLHEILSSERIVMRDGVSDADAQSSLQRIALLGRCDMRRLVHEMQSFAMLPLSTRAIPSAAFVPLIEPSPTPKHSESQSRRPKVESIRPLALHSHEFSLITITGSNFCSLTGKSVGGLYPCHVSIDRQRCPLACIVNDTTIMAVAAPIHPPSDLLRTMRGGRISSHSASYAPVTVCDVRQLGIPSTSCKVVTGMMARGQPSTSLKHLTIEYHFCNPNEAHKNDDKSSSEEEFEAFDAKPPHYTPRTIREKVTPLLSVSVETATKLLQEGIQAWKSIHGELPVFPSTQKSRSDVDDLVRVENMSLTASLQSDCALFEEIGLSGVPYLAGSCKGFGFDLTDQFPKHTNENSKPPSEERLFTSGWKDSSHFYGSSDSFMTHLFNARERKLLKWSESRVRGLAPSIIVSDGTTDELDDFRLSSNVSDETMFLPAHIPSCLLTISSLLLTERASELVDQQLLIETRKATKIESSFDILHRYIFSSVNQGRMRLKAMMRCMDSVILDRLNVLECQIFVDYLPFLRCMAVLEEETEAVFRALEAADPDTAYDVSNRRASARTRSSRRRGRAHYFEEVIPHFARESEETPREVGAIFARSWIY